MPIVIEQKGEPSKFVNPQVCRHKTNDGKELYVLAGIVILHTKGHATDTKQWVRDSLTLILNIPGVPRLQRLVLEQSAVLITINAIGNDKTALNAGWAVDSCRAAQASSPVVVLEADIAVRDTDGWLYRVGYYATLIGHFDNVPPP